MARSWAKSRIHHKLSRGRETWLHPLAESSTPRQSSVSESVQGAGDAVPNIRIGMLVTSTMVPNLPPGKVTDLDVKGRHAVVRGDGWPTKPCNVRSLVPFQE